MCVGGRGRESSLIIIFLCEEKRGGGQNRRERERQRQGRRKGKVGGRETMQHRVVLAGERFELVERSPLRGACKYRNTGKKKVNNWGGSEVTTSSLAQD